MMFKNSLAGVLILLLGAPFLNAQTAGFNFKNEAVPYIIKQLERQTGYLFLYRESQVAHIKVSLQASHADWVEEFTTVLAAHNLNMVVDRSRNQVLIVSRESSQKRSTLKLSGFVSDAETGERLPFAVIMWNENQQTKGLATDENGSFYIQIPNPDGLLTFSVSYLGFETQTLELNPANSSAISQVSFRLKPRGFYAKEVVINGTSGGNSSDELSRNVVDAVRMGPLGEDNSMRALQGLAAVGITPAINNGLNIRGSASDGFRIFLDGVAIYNQSHLFGLLDSFNSDVLKGAGFYYEHTPAEINSPTGGVLLLNTKSGTLNGQSATVGISNTSVRGTLESVIVPGKSSIMISGRHSYLNDVDWFNNRDLVKMGLDINQPQSIDNTNSTGNTFGRTLTDFDAFFYDLHGKFHYEAKNGIRLQLSAYSGKDDSSQEYERCLAGTLPCRNIPANRNRIQELQTRNNWLTNALALNILVPLKQNIFWQTHAGFSSFDMNFLKDDFLFSRELFTDSDDFVVRPLLIENALNETNLKQTLQFGFRNMTLTAGAQYFYYDVQYREDSFQRVSFISKETSHQADVFAQADLDISPVLEMTAGSRFQYFSNGKTSRLSPRLSFKYQPANTLSFYAGYSKNVQFINRISFSDAHSADIWLSGRNGEPPTEVQQLSSGVTFNPNQYLFLKIEGYIKHMENLRLHELTTIGLNSIFKETTPIFFNNDGTGRGLEVSGKTGFGLFSLHQSYTLSSLKLHNPEINDGQSFFAAWDRRHQLQTVWGVKLSDRIQWNTTLVYATGEPNGIFREETRLFGENEAPKRLPDYTRLDTSIRYFATIGNVRMDAGFYIYNLLDKNNVQFRSLELVTNNGTVQGFSPAPVNFFDVGLQPSFNIRLSF